MMSRLLLILLLLQAPLSFAQDKPTLRLTCSTDPLTNSLVFYEQPDGGHRLSLLFHWGPERMVLHQGTITPADLELMQKRADLLRLTDDRIEVSFQKGECRQEDGRWICSNKQTQKASGLVFQSAYFTTHQKTEQWDHLGFNWRSTEVLLALNVRGDELPLRLSFYGKDCRSF